MRTLYVLLLVAVLLSGCASNPSETLAAVPASTDLPVTPSPTRPSITPSPTIEPPRPSPTLPPATFTVRPGASLPLDGPLLAYESGSAQDKILLLADPLGNTSVEFHFPATAHFATPFLAGLSPDARYFVYFEGGRLETLYEIEHLRLDKSDLVLHILDLRSGEIIFSAPLLSPSFPRDLATVAETIQEEWFFTSENATFADVVAATQELMLDRIRSVAWSPDGSLLAFASQDPGPTSDLYLFSLADGAARRVTDDPAHILRTVWAPDSASLVTVTSLYDRHAREDTTYLLSRDGSLVTSFTSQVWWFSHWHDSTYAFLDGGTDAGDYFEPKVISASDGTTTVVWNGSYEEIAFSPDLSTFLLSSNIPSAPDPPGSGLYLGRQDAAPLLQLSEIMGWGVAYWGSPRFAFAASSIGEGTVGVNPEGERVPIDAGAWKLSASPDGSYLAGYYDDHPSYVSGIVPGLRIFDGEGLLTESVEDVSVACVRWNAASTSLAYQSENRLYLWDSASGLTRLVSDQLDPLGCAFVWVRDSP